MFEKTSDPADWSSNWLGPVTSKYSMSKKIGENITRNGNFLQKLA